MNSRLGLIASLVAGIISTIVPGEAAAGGLKDTSYELFSTVGFPADPSDLSANPWWNPAGTGKTLYFADTEDGCEWNLVEDAGQLVNGFTGGDFSGLLLQGPAFCSHFRETGAFQNNMADTSCSNLFQYDGNGRCRNHDYGQVHCFRDVGDVLI